MDRHGFHTYEEAVEYLLNIPRFTSKHTMEDTEAFLERLGNPEKTFRIIHVAGTNGKGSVCAYLRYMLEEAGYRVCLFTSPHLVDIRERFLIEGKVVEQERFMEAFCAVYDLIEELYHPTFFEYLFFMAMLLFRDSRPDYVILETGLGGRLDATNSVSHKELTVITRISLDHVEYLGDTPEKIAFEKAGIMRKNVPAVFWDTSDTVSAVFVENAKKLGAFACPVSKKDYAFLNFRNKNIDFSLHTRYYNDISLSLHTNALYQIENASLAVRALEELDQGKTIGAEQIRRGLLRAFWPGRMEEVAPNVFVDGAHNEDGVRAFLESVGSDGWQGDRTLLFSAVRDKQFEKMLDRIICSGLFSEIDLVSLRSGRRTPADELEQQTRSLIGKRFEKGTDAPRTKTYEDVESALGELERLPSGRRLYIAGSLYLVGEVKEHLNKARSFDHDKF